VKELAKLSAPVVEDKDLENVASVSAGNNPEIGALISKVRCMHSHNLAARCATCILTPWQQGVLHAFSHLGSKVRYMHSHTSAARCATCILTPRQQGALHAFSHLGSKVRYMLHLVSKWWGMAAALPLGSSL
jgi:hypothetical protein